MSARKGSRMASSAAAAPRRCFRLTTLRSVLSISLLGSSMRKQIRNLQGRRAEQDDEHGGENAQQRWEEDLYRRLVGHFLGPLLPVVPAGLGVHPQGLHNAGGDPLGLQ